MSPSWRWLRPQRARGGQRPRVSQALWWEKWWREPPRQAPFLGRPISPEIVEAVEQGWLPRGGHVLDAGCGEGIVAAWFTGKGFTAVGVDIAPSAIERARSLHGESDALRYHVADLLREPPPSQRPFDVVIDRGCLHQMRDRDLPAYVRNLTAACAPDARMMILYRAYRGGIRYGNRWERRRIVRRVRRFYRGCFELERVADAWADRNFGHDPDTALGAVAMWLRRVDGDA